MIGPAETGPPPLIGITGGIGAGKSCATEYLRGKGYTVIDADEVARDAAAPGQPAAIALREAFGGQAFHADGTLDRAALAAIAFSDKGALARLNAIMHADIGRRMDALVREARETQAQARIQSRSQAQCDDSMRDAGQAGAASGTAPSCGAGQARKPIFLSIPLLFENGMEGMVDAVWLVTADDAARVARVMERDGCGEGAVRARMAAQMPEGEKRARADIVLCNDGTPDELRRQIDAALAG